VPSAELRSNLSFRYCRSCGYVDVEEDFRRVRMPWMLAYKKTAFKVDANALRVPREVRQAIRAAKSRLEKGARQI
jgi:hypothetical protein